MLTYQLTKSPGLPLYESLYRCIREDIRTGNLKPGDKLPSKRALAENLEISKITVESAYSQLLSEGYIRSVEKVGYFVEQVSRPAVPVAAPKGDSEEQKPMLLDLTGGAAVKFPFSVWSKLQREVMLDYGEKLLLPMPNRGILELRQAISDHLAAFRGLHAPAENILIGAGTDFLYNLLIQLLGREITYAVEEPGYGKIRRIYAAGGVRCISAPMDEKGVQPHCLEDAKVLHISPSHHFPTGIVTPVERRRELLDWAVKTEGYIIEDDYDSEFRFHAHPMSALQSMEGGERVIYMNSFSKSLAPSIRISYMVLPDALMAQFQQKLGFYSCTVPSFEQYTLARFLSRGYFEKHINRMRKFYQTRRNRVLRLLEGCAYGQKMTVMEQDAGLHFLLRIDTAMSDNALCDLLRRCGIAIYPLSHYYHGDTVRDTHCLVVCYAGADEQALEEALSRLPDMMGSI